MILESIKKEIRACGKTRYQIAKETGICEGALSRLVNRKRRSIYCETADILLKYFGYELRKKCKIKR
jgi:plasmid maintenance system antidote protein VapI